MHLYPNPSCGHFTIDGSSRAENIDINVTDWLGRSVFSQHRKIVPGQFSIPVDIDLPRGVYYARLMAEDLDKTEPLVVE